MPSKLFNLPVGEMVSRLTNNFLMVFGSQVTSKHLIESMNKYGIHKVIQ